MTQWRILCALVLLVAASSAAPAAADDEASAEESAEQESGAEELASEAPDEAAPEPDEESGEDVEAVEPDLVEASPPPPEASPSDRRGGISPVMFFVAAGLTAASAGLTIWSVVDMNGDVDAYEEALDRAEETRSLDDLNEAARLLRHGDDKELRTELFLGVTAGMAVLTTGLFFLVDWSNGDEGAAPATASVGVSPDGARLLIRGRL